MDLIKTLDEKFNLINAKLISKPAQIERIYKNEHDKLSFDRFSQDQYENGLNEQREHMLKQLISKRDEKLKQVNDFIANNPDNLSALSANIKLNNISFARSLISVYDSIYGSKLESKISLTKSISYSIFTTVKITYNLVNLQKMFELKSYKFVKQISADLAIFSFYVTINNQKKETYFALLNRNSDVVKLKKIASESLNIGNNFNTSINSIKTNSTNIIVFYVCHKLVGIYNFYNFDLVHSFKLSENIFASEFGRNVYTYKLKLNGYEIGFFNKMSCYLSVYNYKSKCLHLKDVRLNTKKYFPCRSFQLKGLNDKFVYLKDSKSICVYDRVGYGYLYRFDIEVEPLLFCFDKNLDFFVLFAGFSEFKVMSFGYELKRCDGVEAGREAVGLISNFADEIKHNKTVYLNLEIPELTIASRS